MGFSEQLISILDVQSVDEDGNPLGVIDPGATVVVLHNLHLVSGQKLVPNFVIPDFAALVVVAVDDTTVSIKNPTTLPIPNTASSPDAPPAKVWVEHKHTISGFEHEPDFLWQGTDPASDDFLSADFVLYVNSVTGNDKNKGTQNKPIKTVKEALSRVPPLWGQKAQIFFASGNYPIPGNLNFACGRPNGTAINPTADGIADQLSAGLQCIGTFASQVGNRQVSAISPDQYDVTIASLTSGVGVDQYRGAWLTTYDGSNNVIQRNLIRSNTASGGGGTTFTLVSPFLIPVSIGDTVKVELTGVTWTYDTLSLMALSGGTSMSLSGIALQASGPSSFVILTGLLFVLDGVKWDMANSGGCVRTDGAIIDFAFSTTLNSSLVSSAGLNLLNAFITDDARGGGMEGVSVMTDCLLFMDSPGGFMSFRGTSALRTTVLVFQGTLFTNNAFGDPTRPDLFDTDSGFGFILGMVNLARGTINNCEVSNSSGDAVLLVGGDCALGTVQSISGTGNAGFGFNILPGAMSRIQLSAGAPSTVTGGAGDTNVAGTTKAYGALPFSPTDASGPLLSRIDIQ